MSKKVLVKKIGVAVVTIALLMGTNAFVQIAEIIGTNVMVKAENSVQETQSGSFNYEENDDGGITITGFIGTETDVVIPNSIDNKTVTEIGDSAFRGCTGLKSINISDSITKIGWCAFFDCENLSTVVIPDGLVEIENYAFEGCTSLSSITIPDSVQKIGYETFKRSDPIIYGTAGSYFHKYVLDNPYLSHFASANNKDFSIGLNDDDTIKIRNYIGTESDVVIPSEIDGILVTTVETFIFGSSVENVQTIILPESLTYIEEDAFRFRPKIYGIEGSYANKYCNYYGYEFFSLSNKDYSIISNDDGTLSIERCYSKDENIELPEKIGSMTVKSIKGYGSFEYADNIKSITIPKTFTDLDFSPFVYCDKLESMYIHEDNPNYTSVDGVVYNKDITELVYCPKGKTGIYVMPNSVEKMNSFHGNSLDEIVLSEKLQEIPKFTFGGSKFKKLKLPVGLKKIGSYAFAYSFDLESIELSENLTTIDYYAFANCTALKSIVIPKKVDSIQSGAFDGCQSLVSVTVLNPNVDLTESYIGRWSNSYVGYTMDWTEPQVTMYGYKDSTAEQYANLYDNITFIALDDDNSLFGDTNGDGKVTIADSLMIARYEVKLRTLTDEQLAVSDVNYDGKVTIADALKIARYEVKLISSLER